MSEKIAKIIYKKAGTSKGEIENLRKEIVEIKKHSVEVEKKNAEMANRLELLEQYAKQNNWPLPTFAQSSHELA